MDRIRSADWPATIKPIEAPNTTEAYLGDAICYFNNLNNIQYYLNNIRDDLIFEICKKQLTLGLLYDIDRCFRPM